MFKAVIYNYADDNTLSLIHANVKCVEKGFKANVVVRLAKYVVYSVYSSLYRVHN